MIITRHGFEVSGLGERFWPVWSDGVPPRLAALKIAQLAGLNRKAVEGLKAWLEENKAKAEQRQRDIDAFNGEDTP